MNTATHQHQQQSTKSLATALDGEYMSRHDVARVTRKNVRTIDNWRARGYGPPWLRVGNTVLYRTQSVRQFLNSHERGGAALKGAREKAAAR